MPTVVIKGQSVSLSSRNIVGSGGEADIYLLPDGNAVKLFKTATHADLKGNPLEQEGARRRGLLMQTKLPDFPKNLPPNVVAPVAMAYGKNGRTIVGYVLPFVNNVELLKQLTVRNFREQQNIGIPDVLKTFRRLHATVTGIHAGKVVIGDFNYLNVLFNQGGLWLIDADSMQWGKYPCIAFTQEFVDPLLCDPRATSLQMVKPHNVASDWYAFNIMLMKAALYVGPYGGVYKPKNAKKRIAPGVRPLKRVTVFDPEVVYPKPAVPYTELPGPVLDFLQETFRHDLRQPFPIALLDEGLWSGKTVKIITVLQPATTVNGTVTTTVLFKTEGRIVMAAVQSGKLRVLHHQDNAYLREDKSKVVDGAYDPHLRWRIQGRTTLLAKGNRLIASTNGQRTTHVIDSFGNLPMLDANSEHYYWLEGGILKRSDVRVGQRTVGDVLIGRSLMWAGETFGLGLWYAGELQQGFVFNAEGTGINSSLQLERIPGQLLNATTVFSDDLAWLLVEYQEKGHSHHRCTVINKKGEVQAQVTATDPDEDHWLHNIHGNAAVGNILFSATDQGVVGVRLERNGLATTLFEDTAPFVSSASNLLVQTEKKQIAILVVGDKQVVKLSISQ